MYVVKLLLTHLTFLLLHREVSQVRMSLTFDICQNYISVIIYMKEIFKEGALTF